MIVLKDGVSVSRAALELAWTLEARGVQVHVEGRDSLIISPPSMLSPTEGRAVRAYETELLSLARYCATSSEQ